MRECFDDVVRFRIFRSFQVCVGFSGILCFEISSVDPQSRFYISGHKESPGSSDSQACVMLELQVL